MYTTCKQKNLPTGDRHNEYGSCMEGFSAAVKNVSSNRVIIYFLVFIQNTIITGLIGAIKWTGGVFAKRANPADVFGSVVIIIVQRSFENTLETIRSKNIRW